MSAEEAILQYILGLPHTNKPEPLLIILNIGGKNESLHLTVKTV